MTENKERISPARIPAFLYKFALLLILPVLRTAVADRQQVGSVIITYGFDIALAAALAVYSAVLYRTEWYSGTPGRIVSHRGAVIGVAQVFVRGRTDSVTLTQSLPLRLFSAVRTELVAGSADALVYIEKNKARQAVVRFFGTPRGEQIFRSSTAKTLIMAAAFSNALTGFVTIAPVLKKAADVLGRYQTQQLLEQADIGRIVSFAGLPPLLSVLSTVLFLSWALGMTAEFLQEYGLTVYKNSELLCCEKGVLTRTVTHFYTQAVSAVVMRQSLMMAVFGVTGVQAVLPKKKGNRVTLVTADYSSNCERALSGMGLGLKKAEFELKPDRRGVRATLLLPFLAAAGVCAGVLAATLLLTEALVRHLGAAAALACVLWFLFRLFAFVKAGLSFGGGQLCVNWFSRMSFTRTVIPAEKIRAIRITSTVFQRSKGLCSVRFYLRGRRRKSVRIKQLDSKKTAELAAILRHSPP